MSMFPSNNVPSTFKNPSVSFVTISVRKIVCRLHNLFQTNRLSFHHHQEAQIMVQLSDLCRFHSYKDIC